MHVDRVYRAKHKRKNPLIPSQLTAYMYLLNTSRFAKYKQNTKASPYNHIRKERKQSRYHFAFINIYTYIYTVCSTSTQKKRRTSLSRLSCSIEDGLMRFSSYFIFKYFSCTRFRIFLETYNLFCVIPLKPRVKYNMLFDS